MLDDLTILCCLSQNNQQKSGQQLLNQLEQHGAFTFSQTQSPASSRLLSADLMVIDSQLLRSAQSTLELWTQFNCPWLIFFAAPIQAADFSLFVQLNQMIQTAEPHTSSFQGYLFAEELASPSFVYQIKEAVDQDTRYSRERTQLAQLEQLELWEHIQAFAQMPQFQPMFTKLLAQEKIDLQETLAELDRWLSQKAAS